MAGQIVKALVKGSRKPVSELIEQANVGEFSEKTVLGADEKVADTVLPVKEPVKPTVEPPAAEVEKQAATTEAKEVVETEVQAVEKTTEPEAKVEMGEPLPTDPITGETKSNLNLDNLHTSEDVDTLLNQMAKSNENFEQSRRGVVTNEQTKNEASKYTLEELLGRKQGEAFNAAQITAGRQLLVQSAESLRKMADKVLDGKATEEDMLKFRQMGATHVAIQHQISGMTAEAGRALQAFRIQAKGGQVAVQQLTDALELSGGSDSAKAMAIMIRESKDLKSLNQATRETHGIRTTDLFFEHWINGLLSGPTTHEVNMLSNAAVMIHGMADRLAANGWSKILRSSPEDKVYADETYAQFIGMVMGFDDSLKMLWKSIKQGEGQFDPMSKIEQRKYQSVSSENIGNLMERHGFGNIDKDSQLAKGIDLWGEFIRIPGRALQAEDDMFKVLNYRMELNALSVRQAKAEGHQGDALAARITELINKPTEEIHLGAVNFARENTFTNSLGEFGRNLQKGINNNPPLKIAMPFMRTLVNIQKYVGKRTPLGLLAQSVRADVKAGGAKRDLALGKMTVGSMMAGWALTKAMNGEITGGGHKWSGVRKSDYRQGWQSYSIQGPDGDWIKYDRFDPVGMYLGLVADAYEISTYGTDDDAWEAAGAVTLALYKNMTNKTYAKGLSDLHQALTMGGNYWTNWKNNFVASTVPYTSALSTIERGVDPTIRDAQTVMEKIRSRIPGLSGDLPPIVDLYGNPRVMEGGLMARTMNPFRTSSPTPTYVDSQIRMNEVNINHVNDFLGNGRFKVPLDTWQHHDYKMFASEELFQNLDNLMYSNLYQDATTGPDGGRARLIRQQVSEIRGTCDSVTMMCSGAKGRLLEKYPGLQLEYQKKMELKRIELIGQ